MRLNEKISFLRAKSGFSQQVLAEMLDVSRQTVSKWEMGIAVPSTEKLIGLSQAFHISMDLLVNDHVSADEIEKAERRAEAAADAQVPEQRPEGQSWQIAGQLVLSMLLLSVLTFFALDFVRNELAKRQIFGPSMLLPELSAILQIVGCGVIGLVLGKRYRARYPKMSVRRACAWAVVVLLLLSLSVEWCVLYRNDPFDFFRTSISDQVYFQSVLLQFLTAKVTSPVIAPAGLFCAVFYWVGALGGRNRRKKEEIP